MSSNRDYKIIGKRRAIEIGRWVLAITPALTDKQAQAEQPTLKPPQPAQSDRHGDTPEAA